MSARRRDHRGALGPLLAADRGEVDRLGDQRFELQRLARDVSQPRVAQKEVHHLLQIARVLDFASAMRFPRRNQRALALVARGHDQHLVWLGRICQR